MRKDIAKKVLDLTLPFFNSWEELLNQACVQERGSDKEVDQLTVQDFYRMAEDGWFDCYEADAYADMKQIYGDAFKSETYLKKDGSFKQKGTKSYIWIQYCAHVATALYMKYQGKI